jgi:hypothetical protein
MLLHAVGNRERIQISSDKCCFLPRWNRDTHRFCGECGKPVEVVREETEEMATSHVKVP